MNRKKRLLIWAHCHLAKPGGFERQLVEATRRLRLNGWIVRLCCGTDVASAVRNDLAKQDVDIVKLSFEELNSLTVFTRICARFRPDVCQYHYGSPSPVMALAAKATGARNIMRDHGSRTVLMQPPASLVDHLKRFRRTMIARAVDLYLPVSGYNGDQIRIEVGAPAEKIAVCHNSIDLERFRPVSGPDEKAELRRGLGIPDDARVFAYVGQMTEEKGIRDLLAIQPALLEADPKLVLLWAGAGPLADEVAAASGPRSIMLGRRTDVPELLRAADAMVAPSLWYEAFSLALGEAAATAIPAVASRIGGIPEVVADCETGILITPGDRVALYDAILTLSGHDRRRDEMGRAARARAVRMFNLDRQVEIWVGHIESMIDRPPTAQTRKNPTEVSP